MALYCRAGTAPTPAMADLVVPQEPPALPSNITIL